MHTTSLASVRPTLGHDQGLQVAIHRYGPAHSLRTQMGATERALAEDEVEIAVRYSGVSFADVHMRLGLYPGAPPLPFVPGLELSGVVARVGAKVTRVRPGMEVIAGSTGLGGYASRAVIREPMVLRLPSGLSLAEGAAVPVNFVTCRLALLEMARIRSGDRVLIEGASGGVGSLAVQMAVHVGAEVFGMTSSEWKRPFIESLGATSLMREELEASDGPRELDMVLNASGGASVATQLDRLAPTGRLVSIGFSDAIHNGRRSYLRLARAACATPRFSVLTLRNRNLGIFGLNSRHVLEDPRWIAKLPGWLKDFERMEIRPRVDRVFAPSEVAEAHQHLESRQACGKVLLDWKLV